MVELSASDVDWDVFNGHDGHTKSGIQTHELRPMSKTGIVFSRGVFKISWLSPPKLLHHLHDTEHHLNVNQQVRILLHIIVLV